MQQAHRGDVQGVLRAGDGDDVVGLQRALEQRAVAGGDGFPKGEAAGDFSVVRVALAQGFDGCVGDELRGGEIRVTDAQYDHILAPALGFEGFVVDVPGGDTLP
ncbi:hypothetical protein D3C84_1124020 [compost metagenome]